MERLPQEVINNIGSFCDFHLDEIKIWYGGRPRRNVSSVSRLFAVNFYDSILKQKLARMPISSAPIWRMLYTNIEFWECRQHDENWWQSTGDASDEDFWKQVTPRLPVIPVP